MTVVLEVLAAWLLASVLALLAINAAKRAVIAGGRR